MHCKSLWIKASAKCINVNVNVGFLGSGVTRACLNAVGKCGVRSAERCAVRSDVLIMCVSAGKSVGEIAWRR